MNWEARWQDRDTPWDKGAPAPPLIDLLEDKPEYFKGTVLVPGCGSGHDVIAISQAITKTETVDVADEADSSIIGIDVSPTALEIAQQHAQTSSITFLKADFLTVEQQHFPNAQTIFEHTCFCAIHPTQRTAYRDACARLLPTGGLWIAIIFLKPREEDDPSIGPPFQSKKEEVATLFSSSFELIESYHPAHSYEGREGRELLMVWKRK